MEGRHEVRGVVPDRLIGIRHADTLEHRAADVLAALPQALREASTLIRRPETRENAAGLPTDGAVILPRSEESTDSRLK